MEKVPPGVAKSFPPWRADGQRQGKNSLNPPVIKVKCPDFLDLEKKKYILRMGRWGGGEVGGGGGGGGGVALGQNEMGQ